MTEQKGIKSMATAILDRLSLATRAGISFNGKRDLYKTFGYTRNLVFQDFVTKYLRQDVAKRIVNAPASATWRTPPIVEGPDGFKAPWEKIIAEQQLWKQLERVDKLAGLGNYSVLLCGISDGSKLEKPIRKKTDNKLLYLQPYAQPNAEILEVDNEPTSPRFGMPLMYKITTQDPLTLLGGNTTTGGISKTIKATQFLAHYSRVIHVAEDTLENNFLGTPRLEAVYNLLDDLLKVSGGTSETYWLTANRGMQANIDKDAELSKEDAEALGDELDEYQHQLRRWIRTRGVEIKSLGSEVPDPKNTFSMIMSLISGATGIPQRILIGAEAGQLASDQDRANWADRINERRKNYVEPNMLTPTIITLSEAGILPELSEENLKYNWPPNFQMTPLENAQTMAQRARATINLTKSFSEPNAFISPLEARRMLDLPDVVEGVIPSPPQPAAPSVPGAPADTTLPVKGTGA
jgi:hypothetical protein